MDSAAMILFRRNTTLQDRIPRRRTANRHAEGAGWPRGFTSCRNLTFPRQDKRSNALIGQGAGTLAVAVSLSFAADRITHRQAAMIGIGLGVWDEQAEQIAQLLGGDGWGRHYVALGLMASGPRGTAPDASDLGDAQ